MAELPKEIQVLGRGTVAWASARPYPKARVHKTYIGCEIYDGHADADHDGSNSYDYCY